MGSRPHQCMVCNRTFQNKFELDAHATTHESFVERQMERLAEQRRAKEDSLKLPLKTPAGMEPAPPPLPIPKTPVIKHHVPQISIPEADPNGGVAAITTTQANQSYAETIALTSVHGEAMHPGATVTMSIPIDTQLRAVPDSSTLPTITIPTVVVNGTTDLHDGLQIQTLQPLQELHTVPHHHLLQLPSQQIVHPPPPPQHPF